MTPSFAAGIQGEALLQLRKRRDALQKFVTEAEQLDRVIREQEKLNVRLHGTELPARIVDGKVMEVEQPKTLPERAAAIVSPSTTSDSPTQPERLLAVLQEHPEGLAASNAARLANIPTDSVQAAIARLLATGKIERLGRGFYRVISSAPASVSA